MNIMYRVTLKSMLKNKCRTIVTIIGVIISVAMITAVSTFSASFSSLFRRQEIYENGDWIVSFRSIDHAKAQEVESDSLFDKAGYSYRDFFVQLSNPEETGYRYLELLSADRNTTELNAMKATQGRLPESPNEICLPEEVEAFSSYQPGDTITLSYGIRLQDGVRTPATESYMEGETFSEIESRTFTICGFWQGSGISRFFPVAVTGYSRETTPAEAQLNLTARTLQIQSDTYGQIYDVAFQYQIDSNTLQFHNALLNYSGVLSDRDLFVTFLMPTVIIGLIIMIGSVMLIYNAFAISVSERAKQLGMLASIGATRRQKRRSVLFEGVAIGIVAIPLGILFGILGIGITFWAISPWIMSIFQIDVPFQVEVVPAAIVMAVLFSAFTILISAWLPARRASKITPIEAIRQSQDVRLRAKNVKTSRFVRKLFGFEGELAMKNLKRNRKRYRATILALCVSVVLFLSTAAFNNYMVHAYSMARHEVAYDVAFYAYDGIDQTQELLHIPYAKEAEMNRNLSLGAALPREKASPAVQKVYTGSFEEIPLDIQVIALDGASQERYLEKAGLDPHLLDTKNNAVAINRYLYADGHDYSEYSTVDERQVSEINPYYSYYLYIDGEEKEEHYYTGQPLSIQAFTEERPLCVSEISDSPARLVLVVSEETFDGMMTAYTQQVQAALDAGEDEIDSLVYSTRSFCYRTDESSLLCSELEQYYGYTNNFEEANRQVQNMLNVINVFLYGFITLITVISVANIFNTVSTSIGLRTREFAMLRSVGMTKKAFNKMLRFESMFYGMKALLWGIPISIIICFLMYGSLSRNFDFGFYIPIVPFGIAVLAIFSIVGLTMLYSASKVKKANIISILTQENI